MYMPYTNNPHLPQVRMEAVRLFRSGWTARKVGRYLGYHHTAIMKWVRKAPTNPKARIIPTLSSKPHKHPHSLKSEIIQTIIKQRLKHNRCSEVIHQELINQGIKVSLSSIKRTLARQGLIRKRSPWKRLHQYIERPEVTKTGDLVQIDTIHLMANVKSRIYVYTLIDVFSRWCYAQAVPKISAGNSVKFVKVAQSKASFKFNYLQSDHGSEFSQYFSERIKINHRHSRVRRPTDNGHVERFNRTLQEELIDQLPRDVGVINKQLKSYLRYYNNERLHLGLNLQTPQQWCQAID
jgi:transposase InsO family protein